MLPHTIRMPPHTLRRLVASEASRLIRYACYLMRYEGSTQEAASAHALMTSLKAPYAYDFEAFSEGLKASLLGLRPRSQGAARAKP